MAYRIDYGSGGEKKRAMKGRTPVRRVAAGIVCAVLLAALLFPAGRRALRDLILPGDAEVTAAALRDLVAELQDGEPVGDAVSAFCQEVIAGGTR